MPPYKHQYHGGKRQKSTGVADYFAVLGMDVDDDLLFLRDPPPPPPPSTVPTSLPSQVSPSAASTSSPSNDDANKYIIQDNYAKEIDNATTGPDCTIITSPSSVENVDTTKTPRNSRNLTKKLVPPPVMEKIVGVLKSHRRRKNQQQRKIRTCMWNDLIEKL